MLGEVRAGFPSPADEEPREKLDLLRLLVRHPASTFFFRIGGMSMVDAEMDEGDIIIVDRSIEPYNGCSAVCFIDGEFTVKRVEKHDDHIMLVAANPKFKPLYEDGYRYFYNVDSHIAWQQLGDDYFRGGRRNLDGYRMWHTPKKVADLFDVSEVFDPDRPTPVPSI